MSGSRSTIPVPPQWPTQAADAIVHAVAMTRVAITEVRAGFSASPLASARLRCRAERLESELAQLREQMRLKDARFARIEASKRPR